MWNVTLECARTGRVFEQQFFSLLFLAALFGQWAAILKRNLPVAIFPSSFAMSPIDLIGQLSRDVIGLLSRDVAGFEDS